MRRYAGVGASTPAELIDHLKLTLAASRKRLRRYRKNLRRSRDNRLFAHSERGFYRSLRKEDTVVSNPPQSDEIRDYWASIWSVPVVHNEQADWIREECDAWSSCPSMVPVDVSARDVNEAVARLSSWKAPGPDKLQNYWLKKFTSTHAPLARAFGALLESPQDFPEELCMGLTQLIPKGGPVTGAAALRPITCLSVVYKLFTAILCKKLGEHLELYGILADEQKGCSRGSMGCKEQLTIDGVILGQAKYKQRDLFTAYVDFVKAFDNTPHSWLLRVLQIYKVDERLISLLRYLMSRWQTRLQLRTPAGVLDAGEIQVKRGIFQGDSLSALLFCVALNPLSRLLQRSGKGWKLTFFQGGQFRATIVSHLLYMDDLKLFASNRRQLEFLLRLTEAYSSDVHMRFGVDKCRLSTLKHGRFVESSPFRLDDNTSSIDSLEEGQVYQYLGCAEAAGLDHGSIKQTLTERFRTRLRAVLRSGLNARNMVRAINTYAVSLLTYSFGVVKWRDAELRALDRLVRTQSTAFRAHHPKSAVERVSLPRGLGGRGISDITNLCYRQTGGLRSYFLGRVAATPLISAVCEADQGYTPLNLSAPRYDPLGKVVEDAAKREAWGAKELHGRYCAELQSPIVDSSASCRWLVTGSLYVETEGFMVSIQDQVVATRNYRKYILRQAVEDVCRRCQNTGENIEHVLAGCPALAPTRYLERHNLVAGIVHQELAVKHALVSDRTRYYQYKPVRYLENESYKLYWDKELPTDLPITARRPDIVLVNRAEGTTYLIDISVPLTCNLERKRREKIEKYLPLAAELREMWGLGRVVVVPVVLSATGVIPKTLHESLKSLGLPGGLYEDMQKAAIISTCSLVREFLGSAEHLA